MNDAMPTGRIRYFSEDTQRTVRLQQQWRDSDGTLSWRDIPLTIGRAKEDIPVMPPGYNSRT